MTNMISATTELSNVQGDVVEYNEKRLIEEAQGGCQDAMSELFAHNELQVKKFIYRKISNGHTVEDILQESLIQAFQSIKNFSGRSKFSTWVIGIALNLVRNHCSRSPEYKYNWVSEEHLGYVEHDAHDIETQAILDERMAQLNDSLKGLPEQFKEVISMAAIDGLSHSEIAERLGISPQAVKSRLFRARKLLKDDIGDDYMSDLF